MAALFNPGTWQGTAIRIPGTKKTLSEKQSAQVVHAILPALSANASNQVRRVMDGEVETLTYTAHVEVASMIEGYLKRVPNL